VGGVARDAVRYSTRSIVRGFRPTHDTTALVCTSRIDQPSRWAGRSSPLVPSSNRSTAPRDRLLVCEEADDLSACTAVEVLVFLQVSAQRVRVRATKTKKVITQKHEVVATVSLLWRARLLRARVRPAFLRLLVPTSRLTTPQALFQMMCHQGMNSCLSVQSAQTGSASNGQLVLRLICKRA